MSRELQLVVAVSGNGVIGKAGKIPWQLSEDLKHFKAITLNHPVLMGRKTFESIGRILPHRRNVLISSTFSEHLEGLEIVKSLNEARALLAAEPLPLMVIGGSRLYAEALPLCRVLHVTRLSLQVEGDTFFPEIPEDLFKLAQQEEHYSDKAQCYYRFETWVHV